MLQRFLKRAAWGLLVVWSTVSLTFLVQSTLPSDPARMVAGAQARPADVERVRKQLGLDQPLSVQYARFLKRLVHHAGGEPSRHKTCAPLGPVHVDLGRSYQLRRPVVELIAERLPRTLALGACVIFVQLSLGVMIGVMAAHKRRRLADELASTSSLLALSIPTFVSGVLLQWLLAHELGWLPLDGFGRTNAEHMRCIVLPSLTMGIYGAASYLRMTRDEMSDQLDRDYARTARAKGAGALRTLSVHALRNAAIPLATLVGLDAGVMVGGAIVTEQLFRWPGIGALSVGAALDRDGPVLMGVVLVTSLAVVAATWATDIVTALIDPRIRRVSR